MLQSTPTMTDEQAQPSLNQIRDRIRTEHRALSGTLREIEALSDQVRAGHFDSLRPLREALHDLGVRLTAHLEYEEYRLPVLARDVVSPEQLQEELEQDHRAQRELLSRVVHDLDETAIGQKLIVGVRELIRAIRDDMEYEEAEILSKL